MQYEIEELGVGGILDRAVTLLKNHFGLLFGITLVLLIPFSLLQSFVVLGLMPAVPVQPTPEELAAFGQVVAANSKWLIAVALFTGLFVVPLTNAAIIQAVAKKYLNEPISVGEAMKRSFGIVVPLLVTWMLQGLAILGGLILLIIPGVIFAFWFMLSSHVVVIERQSGFEALKRSKQLMKGNVNTVFVLGFLLAAIQYAIIFCAELVPQPHLKIVGQTFFQAISMIFSASTMVVFYFSCRCKNENFDLTRLAEAVNRESHGEPASDSPYGE
jgi:hypothetical protein